MKNTALQSNINRRLKARKFSIGQRELRSFFRNFHSLVCGGPSVGSSSSARLEQPTFLKENNAMIPKRWCLVASVLIVANLVITAPVVSADSLRAFRQQNGLQASGYPGPTQDSVFLNSTADYFPRILGNFIRINLFTEHVNRLFILSHWARKMLQYIVLWHNSDFSPFRKQTS